MRAIPQGTGDAHVQASAFDARKLRGVLAEERITRTRFAEACGIDRAYMTHILNGYRKPGELCLIKIERGLRALGLPLDSTTGGPDATA
jgi:transcriptional regulator with XRE-family HTH domain